MKNAFIASFFVKLKSEANRIVRHRGAASQNVARIVCLRERVPQLVLVAIDPARFSRPGFHSVD